MTFPANLKISEKQRGVHTLLRMSHMFEPVAIKLDRCRAAERGWLKHRTHLLIIRMVERLEQQLDELSRKLSVDHALVERTKEMLNTAKNFQAWFYASYGFSKYFDLDVYMNFQRKHRESVKHGDDMSKVEDVFRHILVAWLPKYLGVEISSVELARPLYAPPEAELNITLESGPVNFTVIKSIRDSRPLHLEVPIFSESPLRFVISGHRNEDARCDFVNLLAASGLITWVGFIGLRLEIRLWPEEGMEMEYQRTIRR